MNQSLSFLFSLSILPAAILGVIRFKEINKSYYPFIYLCWLAVLAEVVSYMANRASLPTQLPSNVYVLAEALLLVWQFRLWGSFERRPRMYPILLVGFVLFGIIDNFIIAGIHNTSSYSRIGFSLALVILAIDQINRMIVRERKSFLKNAKFLICIAIIIFFSYKIAIEAFYLYAISQESSSTFVRNIFTIQKYVNLLANLIYAYAVLWIPRKKNFT